MTPATAPTATITQRVELGTAAAEFPPVIDGRLRAQMFVALAILGSVSLAIGSFAL
jgi:hypothetical protein